MKNSSCYQILVIATFILIQLISEQKYKVQGQKIRLGSSSQPESCNLDDVQNTRGVCKPFKDCQFAIENYKADLFPKLCHGKVVCCPIEETITEKKCAEWRSYLHTPLNYGTPFPEPRCFDNGQGFITGGRMAAKYEYPHAVALGYRVANESADFVCGGTLISDQYVLTAAHCIKTARGKPLVALLGDITIKRQTSHIREFVPIVDWILHPDYKPPVTYNDIGILKLAHKVELSRYLLPACLPSASSAKRTYETLETVGWGTQGLGTTTSDNLLTVNLTLFTKKECDAYFDDTSDKAFKYPEGIKRSQICAGDKLGTGKDSCNGDSGGSLTVNEIYKSQTLRCLFRVEGVTSFGSKLCGYGTPGVYTKVLRYVPWIERVVFGVS